MTRHLLLIVALLARAAFAQPLELDQGDRVLIVGNTFAERMAESGYLHAVIQARHVGLDVSVRAVPWSADEVGIRPRETNVPTTEDWIERLDPDVVFMFYGMSESFGGAEGLEAFRADLGTMIDQVRAREGDERQVVVFSPIPHEDLGAPWPSSEEVAAHNEDLFLYVGAMGEVAAAKGVRFVNFFNMVGGRRLTTNGIHPREQGCATLAASIDEVLGWRTDLGPEPEVAEIETATRLRLLACDLHYLQRLRYRPTNTEYVWGRRAEPFGVVNFPPEMDQLDRMIEARQKAIWDLGPVSMRAIWASDGERTNWETLPTVRLPEDEWTPEPVEAKGTETSLGDINIKDPDAFLESFTLPEGYVIECFASEQDFEELASPVALTFDSRGRLWVMCIPTYPHLLPGDEPKCKLVILEDTDGDGRADTRTVFADRLYIPTGFAVDTDAVYVGQAPDLLRLRDLDGDDRADSREVVLSGFAMPDSHHQISAFEWMPGGGFLMNEGVFSKTGIETPYGTRRTRDAAVWKFDPRTERLDVMSHCGYANPWGHAYGDYAESMLADASGGDNFAFSQVIHAFDYPNKPSRPGPILNRGRPTAGCELISGRHFPDDVQDTFLVNQSIGYHGTRWDRLIPDGSAWRAERMPQDLIECSDVNFRPVAMEIGPDGALYIVDWCNPIIGHMQYSVRDPRRDNSHGRIWRVRYESRPLVQGPDVAGASIPELFEMLQLPERNTRQLARRRLQTADWAELAPALDSWIQDIDPNNPLRDRLHLEALWIKQGQGAVDVDFASRVLGVYEPLARAGSVRVVRHWLQAGEVSSDEVVGFLRNAADDPDMRVRLEAVSAAGFLSTPAGVSVITRATEHEMDGPMSIVVRETVKYLNPGDGASTLVRLIQLDAMPADELAAQEMDETVAGVIIARADMPDDLRDDALTALAGEEEDARAEMLVRQINAAATERQAHALGGMLLAMPADVLLPLADRFTSNEESRTKRAIATAVLLRGAASADESDVEILVDAMELLPSGEAPPSAIERVRTGVESEAAEPVGAIREVVRHDGDQDAVVAWLVGLVDEVEDSDFGDWGSKHERAMAALRGLNSYESLAPGLERYRVAIDAESIDRGREIYMDEGVGCVRCHAENGRGLEGFPPLDRSAWLVGDPVRAASIVIHGLQGQITVNGAQFNSAMAPLGSLLDDDQVADVLTFARQSWGNYAAPVTGAHAAEARAAAPKSGIWSVPALAAAHPLTSDGLVVSPVSAAQRKAATGRAALPMGTVAAGFVVVVAVTFVMAFVLFKVGRATS